VDIQTLLEKYQDELKVIGEFTIAPDAYPPGPIQNSPITARENFLRFARREKPVFMPFESDEVMVSPAIFPDAIARALCFDNVGMRREDCGGKDMFGVEWEYVPQVRGSMVKPGNPIMEDVTEWESVIHFPNMDEWDWEGSSKLNANLFGKEFATDIWIMNGLFERLISWMDFEGAAMTLIDDDVEEEYHALMDRLTCLYEDLITRIKKYYDPDIIYFHDDWGSQRAPFFSPDTCREKILPYLKRVVAVTHKNGMLFNFHSCGCIGQMVPLMIEAGVDIWAGQSMNDHKALYDQYGRDIAMEIYLIPPTEEASEEDVLEAVQTFLDTYTTNDGCAAPMLYGPAHPLFRPLMYCLSRERFAE